MSEADQCQALGALLAPETWPPDTSGLDPALYTGAFQEIAEMLKLGMAKPDIMAKAKKRGILPAILQANPDINPAQAKIERLASRWQLITAAELMQPVKPPNFLIGRIIRKPALICFYGAPGSLKTMLAYDMAVCVAAGIPWLPHLPGEAGTGGGHAVSQAPGLIVDLDNGPEGLQERIGALSRGRGLTTPPPYAAISLPNPLLNLAMPEDTQNVIDQARALGAGFILIDNLGTASGGADENSSQMVPVMANLRHITNTTGAVVNVIHHSRKAPSNGREGDRLRGHSSIEAAFDLALMIERDENLLTIKSTKTRANEVMPFIARWTFEDTQEGALEWARFWHIEDIRPKRAAYQETAAAIPEILKALDHQPSQTELIGLIRDKQSIGQETAIKAIAQAVKAGDIKEAQDGQHKTAAKRYSIG